jgi:hypothetical protein
MRGPASLAVVMVCLAGQTALAEGSPEAGVWQGRYRCVQGETLLRLTILPENGAADHAFFYFYPPPGTNAGQTGCFTMIPRFDAASRRLSLGQGRWIDRPIGYVMVSLDGVLDEGTRRYSGTVRFEGCGDFSLEAAPLVPDEAEACRPLSQ